MPDAGADGPEPPRAGRTGAARLGFIEVGRGLAALAVVIFHANASAPEFGGPFWQWPRLLQHGVDFFFVLSGFIILHAHRRDIGDPASVPRYVVKRAIRLLPLLWIVVCGWAALRLASGMPIDGGAFLRSVLPYPSLLPTMPVVVWTLRHELVFYALFVVLLVTRRGGIAVFGIWLALVVAQFAAVALGAPVRGVPAFFVSGFALDFMLGMGASVLCHRSSAPPSAVPLLVGLVVLGGALVATVVWHLGRHGLNDYVSSGATFGTALLGLAFALVVVGLVRIEGRVSVPRPLAALGAASYALYLVHTVCNSVSQRFVALLPDALKQLGAGHLILVVLGVAVGFMLHYWCEGPVIDRLRSLFLQRSPVGRDRAARAGERIEPSAPQSNV